MNQWFKIALYAFLGILIGTFLLGIITPSNHMYMGGTGTWNTLGPAEEGHYWMDYKMGPGYMEINVPGMGMGMRSGMGMYGMR
ncbi:hypothetical protein Tfer_0738 [Thermincola ferriacetica]|uniref:Uncharacterized protein n=1 Tax=Thermincola ferriacetica TaxID=281456 RepID=A0A0L6W623_9FIRM|nr:hypothetical protein [Thermincola ferriacetica]KNZ70554.1 hypothetical protein Tfer_0738 [Thermincola ferriacetica]